MLFISSVFLITINTNEPEKPTDDKKELEQTQKPDQNSAEYWHEKAKDSFAIQNLPVALEYVDKSLEIQKNYVPSLVLKIKLLLLQGGDSIKEAQKLANESYGLSDYLDKWLKCLEEMSIFYRIIVTEIYLNNTCYLSKKSNITKKQR